MPKGLRLAVLVKWYLFPSCHHNVLASLCFSLFCILFPIHPAAGVIMRPSAAGVACPAAGTQHPAADNTVHDFCTSHTEAKWIAWGEIN